jgi:separase
MVGLVQVETFFIFSNCVSFCSPTVVGNLWEVTDKDIDQFAMRMLEDWGLLKEAVEVDGDDAVEMGPSIATCVAEAREECTLKYLNGAAPVVYGVPSFVRRS